MHDKPIHNLVKSLLASFKAISHDFSHLAKSFKNQNDTPREKTKPYEESEGKPTSVVASLSTPIAIRVDAETHERESAWKRIKTGLEIVGIVAVIIYAFVTYQMWREMINGTDVNARSVSEARLNRLQADKSLYATIEQFHLDQRAWVGPTSSGIANPPIEPNKPIEIGINFSNSGKTPALKVGGFAQHEFVASDIKINLSKFHPNAKELNRNTLFPGAPNHFLTTIQALPKPVIDDLLAGHSKIYVFGIISYTDIFKRDHWTHFCLWYSPTAKGFMNCDSFNETDDTSK